MASERVIVVGAGGISGAWFPHIKAEGLQVAAVVDLRKSTAEEKIAKYELAGTPAYDDMHKAFAEVKADFVIDLTIPDAHCNVTCAALEAGFHVVGEKPMAATLKQARKMVETSEKTGRLFMVSQSRRWNGHHTAIERQLDTATLGTLTTLNCDFYIGAHFGGFRDEMASPLILDMAIHHFDMARMFCKQNPVSVFAEEFNPTGSWYKGDVAANVLFEMTNGVRFAYRGSWCAEGCHTGWDGDWRFIGDRGTIVYSDSKHIRGQVVANDEGFHRKLNDLSLQPDNLAATGMHGALREMLRFLRTGQKPQTECHDNIHSLAMVIAAIESSKQGRRVKVSEV
jgi:predicted dehydrogenase